MNGITNCDQINIRAKQTATAQTIIDKSTHVTEKGSKITQYLILCMKQATIYQSGGEEGKVLLCCCMVVVNIESNTN